MLADQREADIKKALGVKSPKARYTNIKFIAALILNTLFFNLSVLANFGTIFNAIRLASCPLVITIAQWVLLADTTGIRSRSRFASIDAILALFITSIMSIVAKNFVSMTFI